MQNIEQIFKINLHLRFRTCSSFTRMGRHR